MCLGSCQEEKGGKRDKLAAMAATPCRGAQRTLWCPCSAWCPTLPARGLRRHLLLLLLLPSLWPPAAALKPALPPIVPDRPFLVAWNAPSTRCLSAYHVPLDLDAFGILVNRREAFTGGNITIFYYDQLGLYPYYQNSSVPPTAVNGGCPQNASLQDHLGKMVKDILRTMPSESFAGLAVIDWENWRPLWIRNWDKKNIYRSMSAQLVRRGNPGWSDQQVDLRAKWEFEKAAVNFMSETLKLARALRPRGWWGYYLFPDCYNYHYWDDFGGYTGHCPPLEVQRNDKLLWLWEQSRALYPSIYMEEVLRNSPQGRRFVGAKLREALRVAELPSVPHSLPVFTYARPFYTYTLKELSQADLVHTIGQAAALGAHGVVLWGDVEYSRNRSNCQKIRNYLLGALGPYIVNVTLAAQLCSRQLCHGHGRCLRRRPDSDAYLHLDAGTFHIRVVAEGGRARVAVRGAPARRHTQRMARDFACHCYQGWRGERCVAASSEGPRAVRATTTAAATILLAWMLCSVP